MADRFEDARVEAALDLLSPSASPDVARAYARQRTFHRRNPDSYPQRRSFMATLWEPFAFLRRPVPAIPIAAAFLMVLSLFTSPVQSLAGQFLTIFRVQDFQPIRLTEPAGMGLASIPDLTRFGDMSPNSHPSFQPRPVADAAAASSVVGFPIKLPAQLPASVGKQPSSIAVSDAQSVSFTFRADKTRAYLDSIGRHDFSLPPKFDGASIQVNVPAGVMATFSPPTAAGGSLNSGGRDAVRQQAIDAALGSVTVIEAKAPTVDATGVSFEELREFLLSLPGLSPQTAAQIRAIGDLNTTLPVPIPSGTNARKVQVNGAPGLIMAEQSSRLLGGVVWQANGTIYAVGGAMNESELLSIASSLR